MECINSICNLVAPSSLHWEIGNALVAMMRRGRINLDTARRAISLYRMVELRFVEADLVQATELAERHDIYAYDAYMIAYALRLYVPILSLDGRLNNAARAAGLTVWEVSL